MSLVAAVAVAACSAGPAGDGVAGDHAGDRTDTGAPTLRAGGHRLALVADQRRYARRLATARTWDVCALHEVAAAERITGVGLARPVPSSEYGCTVRTGSDALHAWWTLIIVVGERLTPQVREQYRQRRIGGTEILQGGRGSACTALLPVGGSVGIRLTAIWEGPRALPPVPAPCHVAAAYLRAVLPAWRDPPPRSQARGATATAPARRRLLLAGRDPCGAIPELFGAGAFDAADTTVRLHGAAGCAAYQPRTGHRLRVEFALRPWPPAGSGSGSGDGHGRRFMLSGRPAVAAPRGGGECAVTVLVARAPRPRGEGSSLMPGNGEVVVVRSDGGCGQARQQATVVLQDALS